MSASTVDPARRAARAWSVLLCGAVFLGAGVAAAFFAFGPLPSRLRLSGWGSRPAEPPPSLAALPAAPSTVAWRPWGAETFAEAARGRRLLLLDVVDEDSHWSALMELGTYADPSVGAWIASNVVPVRIDRDERPDLARRYGDSIPATALLLPTGEALSSGGYVPAERFLTWARRVSESYARSASAIEAVRQEARSRASSRRSELLGPGRDAAWRDLGAEPRARAVEAVVRAGLTAAAARAAGQAMPRDALQLWAEVERSNLPVEARQGASVQIEGALGAAATLEDPVEGGLFRFARCPEPACREHEKRLEVQAGAIGAAAGAGARWKDLAARTAEFVERRLRQGPGRYGEAIEAALRGRDGWIDGWRYYALDGAARSSSGAQPVVDRRRFAAPAAALAVAYRAAADRLGRPELRTEADAIVSTLSEAMDGSGAVRHRLDGAGERGLLDDQLAAARAWLDAGDVARARKALAFAESALRDPSTGGLRVRRSAQAPAPGWEEPVDADGTARAAILLEDLARRSGDAQDAARASAAEDWALARAESVDPVLAARVALRRLPR